MAPALYGTALPPPFRVQRCIPMSSPALAVSLQLGPAMPVDGTTTQLRCRSSGKWVSLACRSTLCLVLWLHLPPQGRSSPGTPHSALVPGALH